MVEQIPEGYIAEVTLDGYRVVHDKNVASIMQIYYASFNKHCFNGELPTVPVCWAKHIQGPGGDFAHVNGVYVHDKNAEGKTMRRFIAIDETFAGLPPLDRQILLHEMVHVKLDGIYDGHGEPFINEFRRVLDADKWGVMGCIDAPANKEQAQQPSDATIGNNSTPGRF
jgi:hypothetical protein